MSLHERWTTCLRNVLVRNDREIRATKSPSLMTIVLESGRCLDGHVIVSFDGALLN